jgi:hypothetical protein
MSLSEAMCKMPVILVDRVVDKKRIIRKMGSKEEERSQGVADQKIKNKLCTWLFTRKKVDRNFWLSLSIENSAQRK